VVGDGEEVERSLELAAPCANAYASRGSVRTRKNIASIEYAVWMCVSPKKGLRSALYSVQSSRVSVRTQSCSG
jgi:hypothetical protein